MAEGKKSPRSKAPARSGGSGAGGKTGGKSGGKFGGKPAGKTGGGARRSGGGSGGQSGGWSTSKPGGKPGGGKPGGFRRDERSDDRKSGGDPRKPREKSERVDDFDFEFDETPRSFPKPAREAGGSGQKGDRPARGPRADRSDRPDRPARPARPEKPRRDDREDRRPPKAVKPAESADFDAPALDEGKSVTAGRNPVRELLEQTPRRVDGLFVRKGARETKVQEIVALADQNRIKVQFVDDSVLRRLYSGTHQGVVAVTAAVEYAELDSLIASVMDAPLPVLLALDKVQDPGNLGAMARTAWALGAAGIIVPRHGGAYIGGGAMRASAGALHHLPVARVTNMSQALDACAEAGLSILCADAGGEDAYQAKVHLPAVLVLGGEEKGVRPGVAKHCGQKLAIPLKRDFDSLNVSQAAAILLARLGRP